MGKMAPARSEGDTIHHLWGQLQMSCTVPWPHSCVKFHIFGRLRRSCRQALQSSILTAAHASSVHLCDMSVVGRPRCPRHTFASIIYPAVASIYLRPGACGAGLGERKSLSTRQPFDPWQCLVDPLHKESPALLNLHVFEKASCLWLI